MLGAESYLYLKTQWDSNLTARINDQYMTSVTTI